MDNEKKINENYHLSPYQYLLSGALLSSLLGVLGGWFSNIYTIEKDIIELIIIIGFPLIIIFVFWEIVRAPSEKRGFLSKIRGMLIRIVVTSIISVWIIYGILVYEKFGCCFRIAGLLTIILLLILHIIIETTLLVGFMNQKGEL